MSKLQTLIRFTDLLTFFDDESTGNVRLHFTPRGGRLLSIEGPLDDVIDRALAVIGPCLPSELCAAYEREMALFSFPTLEEYLRLFPEQSYEQYTARIWLERYERSKASFLEFGASVPDDSLVMPFSPDFFGSYRGYRVKEDLGRAPGEERYFMSPNRSDDEMIGWYIPKKDWWRFFYVVSPPVAAVPLNV